MRVFIGWPVAVLCVGFLSHSALAAPQASIADLLKQGYEIKGTVYVSLQDAKDAQPTATQGQVLVTMQRGQSIAVCEFSWGTWASIATSGLVSFTAADRCDVPGQP
jgi:hypothetical protein